MVCIKTGESREMDCMLSRFVDALVTSSQFPVSNCHPGLLIAANMQDRKIPASALNMTFHMLRLLSSLVYIHVSDTYVMVIGDVVES